MQTGGQTVGMKQIVAFRSFAIALRKWSFAVVVGLRSSEVCCVCPVLSPPPFFFFFC
jgi:hypothetical protein